MVKKVNKFFTLVLILAITMTCIPFQVQAATIKNAVKLTLGKPTYYAEITEVVTRYYKYTAKQNGYIKVSVTANNSTYTSQEIEVTLFNDKKITYGNYYAEYVSIKENFQTNRIYLKKGKSIFIKCACNDISTETLSFKVLVRNASSNIITNKENETDIMRNAFEISSSYQDQGVFDGELKLFKYIPTTTDYISFNIYGDFSSFTNTEDIYMPETYIYIMNQDMNYLDDGYICNEDAYKSSTIKVTAGVPIYILVTASNDSLTDNTLIPITIDIN